MNYVGWFVIIYIISSYLRIYSGRFQDNSRFWLICSLASVFGAVLSVLFFSQTERPYRFVSDSNQIFALLVAVSTFMCFRCLPIRYSKIINSIGAATFGVLLIHANNGAMRQWLWRNMVDCVGHYSANVYITYSIFVVLLIFLICVIIDLIRSYFIEKPFFSLLDKHYNMVIKYDNIFK
jgi:membrane-associated HD superfamily phosphohydrolase